MLCGGRHRNKTINIYGCTNKLCVSVHFVCTRHPRTREAIIDKQWIRINGSSILSLLQVWATSATSSSGPLCGRSSIGCLVAPIIMPPRGGGERDREEEGWNRVGSCLSSIKMRMVEIFLVIILFRNSFVCRAHTFIIIIIIKESTYEH